VKRIYIMKLEGLDEHAATLRHRDPSTQSSSAHVEMVREDFDQTPGLVYEVTIEPLAWQET
jgi:hypothetical protein